MRKLLLFVMLLAIAAIGGCFLDDEDNTFTVSGNVRTEDGDGVPYVIVRLGDRLSTTTNTGYYKFGNVAYNSYTLEAYIDREIYIYEALWTFKPSSQTLVVDKNKHIDFIATPR